MIRDIAIEPKPAEPPVPEIEVDLFAEAPLGANTVAVASVLIRISLFPNLLCRCRVTAAQASVLN
jgi:hypothetical protein